MKFSELVRLLEKEDFRLVKEKGSIRYYGKTGLEKLIRIDYHGSKEVPTGTCQAILRAAGMKKAGEIRMIDLKYSLVIEATQDPNFFGFYSPDLEGFSGVGNSIEDCIYKARWGMIEHLEVMKEMAMAIPAPNPDPTVTIINEGQLAQAA